MRLAPRPVTGFTCLMRRNPSRPGLARLALNRVESLGTPFRLAEVIVVIDIEPHSAVDIDDVNAGITVPFDRGSTTSARSLDSKKDGPRSVRLG